MAEGGRSWGYSGLRPPGPPPTAGGILTDLLLGVLMTGFVLIWGPARAGSSSGMLVFGIAAGLLVVLDRVSNRCGYPTHKPSGAEPSRRARTRQLVAVEIAIGVFICAWLVVSFIQR